jgi:Clp amino terminal domain, pathogenicity island component
MFERYTEKARRVIFFARYEASAYGSPYIGTEHLLLGLIRESKELRSYLAPTVSPASIRQEIEAHITKRERISTSIEIPLTADSKRVLNLAAQEAEQLGHRYVGTEHLLLGLMGIEDCLAASVLTANNFDSAKFRESLANTEKKPIPRPVYAPIYASTPSELLASFLRTFLLQQLRAGISERCDELFAAEAQYIDASGKRWSGEENFTKKLKELFAAFAAPKVSYVEETTTELTNRVCFVSLLWHGVAIPSEEAATLRMGITIATLPKTSMWRIYAIQVTPVKQTDAT